MTKKYYLEIRWALIFSLTMLLWMLFEKSLGLHSDLIAVHAKYTNLFAIPAVVVYIIALLEKRKKFYSVEMTYMQGFITGLIITSVVTILSPINQIITTSIITPEYFPNAIEYNVSLGKMTLPEAEAYFSLKNYILQSIVGSAMMGILTSGIVALFTIRRNKEIR